MRLKVISFLALIMGLGAAAATAAAVHFPTLGSNLGYTYRITPPHLFVCYGIAVLIALYALLADKLRADIASRLSLLPIVLVAGMLVYSFNLTEEGELWAARQAAFDAPSWQSTDQDAFWQAYSEYVGESHRAWYETWGANFVFNDVPLYSNNMWRTNLSQAKHFLEVAGHPIRFNHDGVFLLMAALALQLAMSLMLIIRTILVNRAQKADESL